MLPSRKLRFLEDCSFFSGKNLKEKTSLA